MRFDQTKQKQAIIQKKGIVTLSQKKKTEIACTKNK
jgi:hypothetical protein